MASYNPPMGRFESYLDRTLYKKLGDFRDKNDEKPWYPLFFLAFIPASLIVAYAFVAFVMVCIKHSGRFLIVFLRDYWAALIYHFT